MVDGKTKSAAREICDWLVEQGLNGIPPDELVDGLCCKLNTVGVKIKRMHLGYKALHPEYGAMGFEWHNGQGVTSRERYQRSVAPHERWAVSPFYYLLSEGVGEYRQRLSTATKPHQFPVLDEFADDGATDYLAVALSFKSDALVVGADPNNPPEGLTASWTSDAPGGWSEDDLAVLRGLIPSFALALKSIANEHMAHDVLATYLGRDAGERVLSGAIQRGSVITINAVICCFDLQGFTKISETQSGKEVIDMLNDFFEAVVGIVESHHGNVLKFMGDGLLAIFSNELRVSACRSAAAAARDIQVAVHRVAARRLAEGRASARFTLALHAGEVMYGNIGGDSRLDFTVIGPAVNATARILSLCRNLDESILISATVAEPLYSEGKDLVPVGRYKLRGIGTPIELFTTVTQTPAKSV